MCETKIAPLKKEHTEFKNFLISFSTEDIAFGNTTYNILNLLKIPHTIFLNLK